MKVYGIKTLNPQETRDKVTANEGGPKESRGVLICSILLGVAAGFSFGYRISCLSVGDGGGAGNALKRILPRLSLWSSNLGIPDCAGAA